MRTVVVALLLVLAACGGGTPDEDPKASPSAPKTTVTKTTPAPTPAVATGTPAPAALSQFRCRPDAKGVWNASGVVSNSSKNKVTFQVTVVIGEATGEAAKARTKQLASIAAKSSVSFVITKIPAPKAGGPCHVQVLAVN